MQRYILTGAPGAGKTTILRALEARGCGVVEEAATDVIAAQVAEGVAEPWTRPSFVEDILQMQRERQMRAAPAPGAPLFFDRSPACTCALGRYLGFPASAALSEEMQRIRREGVYQRQVFFIDNLGFVEPTAARRISFEDSLRFEAIHLQVYLEFGYDLVRIPPDEPQRRADLVLSCLG